MSYFSRVRTFVFWPTFLVLIASLAISYINIDRFVAIMDGANAWILDLP